MRGMSCGAVLILSWPSTAGVRKTGLNTESLSSASPGYRTENGTDLTASDVICVENGDRQSGLELNSVPETERKTGRNLQPLTSSVLKTGLEFSQQVLVKPVPVTNGKRNWSNSL